jgi:hypothetical protein
MTTLLRGAAAAAGSMLMAAVAFSASADPEGGRPIKVTMTGAAEAPGPGDPDGTGTANFRVNVGQKQVCYELVADRIDSATAAHIHRAAPGVAGPVVVPLAAPTHGTSEACATVTKELAKELIQTPEAFYVNVHNAAFPAGAIRGQLTKAPPAQQD